MHLLRGLEWGQGLTSLAGRRRGSCICWISSGAEWRAGKAPQPWAQEGAGRRGCRRCWAGGEECGWGSWKKVAHPSPRLA